MEAGDDLLQLQVYMGCLALEELKLNVSLITAPKGLLEALLEREFGSADGVLYEGTVTDFYPEWEDSFELKSGSRKAGRRKIEELVKAINPEGGKIVLEGGALTRAWVPTDGSDDRTWFLDEFDDSDWRKGVGGTGYETQSGLSLIHISEPTRPY